MNRAPYRIIPRLHTQERGYYAELFDRANELRHTTKIHKTPGDAIRAAKDWWRNRASQPAPKST